MKRKWVLEVLEAVFFVLGGMALSVSLPGLVSQLASDAPVFLRYLPLFFITFALLSFGVSVHVALHPRSKTTYRLAFVLGGALTCLFGAGSAISSILLFANGTFDSLVEGGITWIYPLDSMIFGFLFDFAGLFWFLYGIKKAKNDEVEFLLVPLWQRIVILDLLIPLYCGIAAFFSVPITLFFLTYDFTFAHFFATLPWYMLMLLPLVELAFYEFFLRKLDGFSHFQVTMKAGSIFLLLGLVFSIYGYFASAYDPQAIPESLTFAFPLDFLVSLPIGPVLLYLINILPPMAYLLATLFHQQKKRN